MRSSARSPASRDVVAIPGDVADPEHRRALVEAAGERIDLLVNNAGLLGPSPQPALAAYPLSELARVYEVNVFAPLALVQEALPRLVPGAAILAHLLGRGGRAVRGLGRVRLLEGRARAADGDPRGRAAAAAGVHRRPGRHAHADLPGGVPGRGHLPPAAAGGERARAARADRGLASERPLPGARARGRCSVSALELPVRLEAHEPPEARGLGRDDVAMLVATRHDLELVHARFRELPRFLSAGDLLVVNTSATLPAALEARLGERTGAALALDSRARRHVARRAANWRAGAATGDRPSVLDSTCPAAPRPSCSHASPAANGSPSPDSSSTSRSRTTFAGTAGRSATATSPSRGRSTPTRPSSPSARERGDAERRPALHGGARHGARRARRPRRARHPARGRLLARARRAALPRALPGPGRDRQARQRRPRLERPRDRGRHDRRARARDRGRGGRHRVRGPGLDEPGRHARARTARRRRPAHRLARARVVAPRTCSRRRPVASSSSAPTGPRSSTATSGTSSATCT